MTPLERMLGTPELPKTAKVVLTRGTIAQRHRYHEFCVWVARRGIWQHDTRVEPLAPPMADVMAYKRRQLDEDAFSARYYERIMNDRGTQALRSLHLMGRLARGNLRLLCYCPDGEFCHTHLLITFATTHHPKKFSTPYNYEVY